MSDSVRARLKRSLQLKPESSGRRPGPLAGRSRGAPKPGTPTLGKMPKLETHRSRKVRFLSRTALFNTPELTDGLQRNDDLNVPPNTFFPFFLFSSFSNPVNTKSYNNSLQKCSTGSVSLVLATYFKERFICLQFPILTDTLR